MRRLANQVRQVAIVYLTQVSPWGWVLAAMLFAFMFAAVLDTDSRSLSNFPFSFVYAQFVGIWIFEVAKHQFGHSRARLLPSFNTAHVVFPLSVIVTIGLGLPAILAVLWQIDTLPFVAATSAFLAAVLLARLYPVAGWLVAIAFVLAVLLPGREINLFNVQLPLALSIAATLVGWLGIGLYFFKLCHLSEDDAAYQQLNDETQKVSADGAEGDTRAKLKSRIRWPALADRWHAKIGEYHQSQEWRIIRLLRFGFWAKPIEVEAIGYAILMTFVVGWLTPRTDDAFYLTRSTDYVFLVVPALFAALAPIAVAGSAMGLRVPRLKNEILFPLTRKQLFDDLLLATAWYSLLAWLLGCLSGTAILLYILPDEAKSMSLFVTAALLTASAAVAAYGLSMHVVMWEVKLAQLVVLALFVFGFVTLMCNWWMLRDKVSDVPYWIVALLVCGVGGVMISTARTAWLNLELG